MFSFKPLALYALLAFGAVSSSAIPTQPRSEPGLNNLTTNVKGLNYAISPSAQNIKSLTPADVSVKTVKPFIDSIHSYFTIATQNVKSSDCGCSGGGSGDGLEDLGTALGDLVDEVLELVAEVIDIVDELLYDDINPLLCELGVDLDYLVAAILYAVGDLADDLVGSLDSSVSDYKGTIKTTAPALGATLKLDL